MAVGLAVGTVRLMKRQRHPELMVKVSHHGKKWDRWKPVQPGDRGKIQDVLKNPKIELRRRKRQSAVASRMASRRNALLARSRRSTTIRGTCFYPVIHGIPNTPEVREAVSLMEVKPTNGLLVMVPCRTKGQAAKVCQRAEFGGMDCGSVRGDKVRNDEKTVAMLVGYGRYVLDEGQAWMQKPRGEVDQGKSDG